MALPQDTSVIDDSSGYAVPQSNSTWDSMANAITWGSWTAWNHRPANSMVVVGTVQDRGSSGYFNIKTTADVTGNIAYSVYTSNTGAFAGEETVSNITPNSGNLAAFYGRYYSVVANVTDPSGQIQLRSLVSTSTNSRFDIQYNDVDSSTLDTNEYGVVLPLSRTISAVLNMTVTPHDPGATALRYISSNYIYDWQSNAEARLTADLGTRPTYTGYAVTLTANASITSKANVYLSTDGTNFVARDLLSNTGAYRGDSVDWQRDALYFAYGDESQNSNNLRIFARTGGSSFGDAVYEKSADPNTWPTGPVHDVCWNKSTNPTNGLLAVAHSNSPYVTIYENNPAGTFTKLSNPATLPAGDAFAVAFSPDDAYLAVGSGSSPYLQIYSRSGTTFTKLSDPASLPNSTVINLEWDPTGTYLLVSYNSGTNARVRAYYRSGSTFISLGDITGLNFLNSGVFNLDWNQSSNVIVVGYTASSVFRTAQVNDILLYRNSGNTFSQVSGNVITNSAGVYDVEWCAGGTQLAVASHGNTAAYHGLKLYEFDAQSDILTPTVGFSGNLGNLYAVSMSPVVVTDLMQLGAGNASQFPETGTVLIGSETIDYTYRDADTLRNFTRGTTTSRFGSSVKSSHPAGSMVTLISPDVDTTQKYFATETASQIFMYVGSKDASAPTVSIKNTDGDAEQGTFDALLYVLPEQYMDSTNLGTR
jgi:hypothetical protein